MKNVMLMSAFTAALLTSPVAQAQTQRTQTETQSSTTSTSNTSTASVDIKSIRTAAQLRMALIGPATVSLKTSQMAVDKASNDKVEQFAQFETDEQTTTGAILKELATPVPAMTEKDNAVMQKLQDAKGDDFDNAYLMAQIDGHTTLLSIVDAYLGNANKSATDPMEMNARHMAMLMRSTIRQHLAQAKELQSMID